MKLTYDPRYNIAYISLQKLKNAEVDTIQISDELSIDLAPDGTVYGIELLNANKQLSSGHKGLLVVENSARQKSSKIKLAI